MFTGTGVKLIGRHAGRQVVALLGNDALAEPPAAGSRVELSFDDNAIMRF